MKVLKILYNWTEQLSMDNTIEITKWLSLIESDVLSLVTSHLSKTFFTFLLLPLSGEVVVNEILTDVFKK